LKNAEELKNKKHPDSPDNLKLEKIAANDKKQKTNNKLLEENL